MRAEAAEKERMVERAVAEAKKARQLAAALKEAEAEKEAAARRVAEVGDVDLPSRMPCTNSCMERTSVHPYYLNSEQHTVQDEERQVKRMLL